jgi:hypothetical protein
MRSDNTYSSQQKVDQVQLCASATAGNLRHAQRRAKRITSHEKREPLLKMLGHVSSALSAVQEFIDYPSEAKAVKSAEHLCYGPQIIALELFDYFHQAAGPQQLSSSWLQQLRDLCDDLQVLAKAMAEISPYAAAIVNSPSPLEV